MAPAARRFPWSVAIVLALLIPSAHAEPGGGEGQGLRQAWEAHRGRESSGGFPEGLEIRSRTGPAEVWAEVLGFLPYPFDAVAGSLAAPADWCGFVPLHFNIKACAHGAGDGEPFLVLYSGRKGYEAAGDAYRFEYGFHARLVRGDWVQVELRAERGPLGTRDHRITVEALPVEGGTFVRVGTSHVPSALSRAATAVYVATLGRGKVGFTREPGGEALPPAPVGGMRGIVERNGVRYYLALSAFLGNRDAAPEDRFEAALRTWFDLAARYPELYETDWESYRETKRREREGRLELQRALEAGGLSALPGAR